jgi:hypothetical protein
MAEWIFEAGVLNLVLHLALYIRAMLDDAFDGRRPDGIALNVELHVWLGSPEAAVQTVYISRLVLW